MSARLWTVRRACWELAKLVLTGRGSYDLYLRVDDLSDDAQYEFNDANWAAYHLDWVGGGDGFAVLSAEPEDGAPGVRTAADGLLAALYAPHRRPAEAHRAGDRVTELNLNRARLGLLRAIRDGKVGLTASGRLMQQINRSQKKPVAGAVRELQEHGLVEGQLHGGLARLTGAGKVAAA
jgi:hypothetical protein